MELTSKQRAQLRSLATNMDTIIHVGKDGIGDNLIKQVNDALAARELIKGRVLENSMLTAREAAEPFSLPTGCCLVLSLTAFRSNIRFMRTTGFRRIAKTSCGICSVQLNLCG